MTKLIDKWVPWLVALLAVSFIFWVTVTPANAQELSGARLFVFNVKATMAEMGCKIPIDVTVLDGLYDRLADEKKIDRMENAKEIALTAKIAWDELGTQGQQVFCAEQSEVMRVF